MPEIPAFSQPKLTPEQNSYFKRELAIPYVTTAPSEDTFNGDRRVYFDGSDYWLYVYANSGWRSVSLGGSICGQGTPTSGQSIDASSITKITLSNSIASGITFDDANDRYTIVTAGKYLIIGRVTYQTPEADKIHKAMIYLNNGVIFSAFSHSSNTSSVSVEVSGIYTLAVDDYIELFTFHNSSGAISTFNSNGDSSLSLTKL